MSIQTDKFAEPVPERLISAGRESQQEDVLERAYLLLGGRKDPWFLYVGTIDTHASWRAKTPWN